MFATSKERILSCEEQARDSVQGEDYALYLYNSSNLAIFDSYLSHFGCY